MYRVYYITEIGFSDVEFKDFETLKAAALFASDLKSRWYGKVWVEKLPTKIGKLANRP